MSAVSKFRPFHPGMGQAVAERTYLRKDKNGKWETWGDLARRVSLGNSLLCNTKEEQQQEKTLLEKHIRNASLLMSGRHLQHGDDSQPSRTLEVFSNCFNGETKIATLEYGSVCLKDIVNQMVTVIAGDGIPRSAVIHNHGVQNINKVIFRTNQAKTSKKTVFVSPTHRWILRDGTVTTELNVGDVLKSASVITETDNNAVIHGLIFGDGTGNKSRNNYQTGMVSQGRTYAGIRVCDRGEYREIIHGLLDTEGYKFSSPPHATGDRVYYLGKIPYIKDVPHTTDPSYIDSFIYGWWLADGAKSPTITAREISTTNVTAVSWLKEYASFAGYTITSFRVMERNAGDGAYANGKPLYVIRLRKDVAWTVDTIEESGEAEVYCPEEPITNSFVLSNGLLTGNCSTAPTSFLSFLLLLSGSGVGRSYDNDLMLVNWDNAPGVRCVLSHEHPDFDWSANESVRDAKHKYGMGKDVMWFTVPDTREGWAQAIEVWETAAFEKIHKDKLLIIDFSEVRCKDSLIGGMQNRPASGPVPLMNAIMKAASVRGAELPRWKQAMYVDHFLAECVLVGGARRSARIATMHWKEKNIIDFILVKRPIEYDNMPMKEIIEYRAAGNHPLGFMWSANNSVMVDEEFWSLLDLKRKDEGYDSDLANSARLIFKKLTQAAYGDGTGEPGIINCDKLVRKNVGLNEQLLGDYVGSPKYAIREETELYLSRLGKRLVKKKYNHTVNPCLTADTIIQTIEGPKTIKQLIGVPFIALVNGQGYQSSGFWKTGTKPVFKVETKREYSVRGTDKHGVSVEVSRVQRTGGGYNTKHEWKEVGNLEIGDKVVLPNHRNMKHPHDESDFRKGWLLGEMVGDGGYCPPKYHGYVRFWGEHKEILSLYARESIKYLDHRPRSDFVGKTESEINKTITTSTKALSHLANGYITECAKDILPKLEQSSASMVRGFIRGIFDANGTVLINSNKGVSIRLAQNNINRLTIIQRMLSRFGIACQIYQNRKEAGISLLPNGKGALSEYKVSAMHELIISKDNIPIYRNLIGFTDPGKQKRIDAMNPPRGWYKERFTSPVTAVIEDGVEDVYDCTVEGIHAFDANGILVHNCGEISLMAGGAFCVIADVVPYFAKDLDEAEEAFRVATRALIRVNTMDSIYAPEVKRTNRIGVGITGIHEFAWKFFNLTFHDLIDEEKSKDFWLTMSRFNRAVYDEAVIYSEQLGLNVPHTMITTKPSGCVDPLTIIKTYNGLRSMADIFKEQGIILEECENLEDAWFDLITPLKVYDKNNELKNVTKLYINGFAETLRVEFKNGDFDNVTPNHEFLIKGRDWIRADGLTGKEDIVSGKPKLNNGKMLTVDLEVEDTHSYQLKNGVVVHNSVSKLFGLTEGWHLPAMKHYMRWVQFRHDDPLLVGYKKSGYPTKNLTTYEGTTIVGFPTCPLISEIMPEDKIVTAPQATIEEQYKWLQLGEKYWLRGVDVDGVPNIEEYNNQISYTAKYDPKDLDYQKFKLIIRKYQAHVICCSLMPTGDSSAYEYLPEEAISKIEFEKIAHAIEFELAEDIGREHIDCEGGACPINFVEDKSKSTMLEAVA